MAFTIWRQMPVGRQRSLEFQRFAGVGGKPRIIFRLSPSAIVGGEANVVLLIQDTAEFLAPRFEAMREGLGKMPGVTIVADIAPKPVTKEAGFATMKTILLANPNIDVVLGADSVV